MEASGARNTLDGIKVDSHNVGVERHALTCDLHPPSRSCAEVDKSGGVAEEIVLAIQLYEFVGGSRPVSLLLGEMIIDIQPLLGFGLFPHC